MWPWSGPAEVITAEVTRSGWLSQLWKAATENHSMDHHTRKSQVYDMCTATPQSGGEVWILRLPLLHVRLICNAEADDANPGAVAWLSSLIFPEQFGLISTEYCQIIEPSWRSAGEESITQPINSSYLLNNELLHYLSSHILDNRCWLRTFCLLVIVEPTTSLSVRPAIALRLRTHCTELQLGQCRAPELSSLLETSVT